MPTRYSRRHFLKDFGRKLSVLPGLLPFSKPAFAKMLRSEPRLKIGYLPITDASPLLIAHAKGYFAEEGLLADKPVLVRSWSTLSESFLTNKFNVTHMLLPIPIWMRFKLKFPAKIMAWDHTNGSAITVRGDTDISGFKDLGGKQIAVPYWYSMHNVILQLSLRKFGLTPVIQPRNAPIKKNQVNLFILPPSEMPAALAAKKIDGYIVAEPFNALGELKIRAKVMRFTGDIWKNHPCCVVVMNEKLTQAQPGFTQKVINAIVRAQLYLIREPEQCAMLMSRDGKKYLPVPYKVLLKALTGYDLKTYGKGNIPQAIRHPEWRVSRVGFQPYPYPSATRFIFSEMQNTLVEGDTRFLHNYSADFVAKDLVDDNFVKKAIKAVGGPEKFSLINIQHPWEREETIDV